jgi:hypothetical protein
VTVPVADQASPLQGIATIGTLVRRARSISLSLVAAITAYARLDVGKKVIAVLRCFVLALKESAHGRQICSILSRPATNPTQCQRLNLAKKKGRKRCQRPQV